MKYEIKRNILAGTLIALAAVYILTFVFSAENSASRSSTLRLISESAAKEANLIEFNTKNQFSLEKENNEWKFKKDNLIYPAKAQRIEDFLQALSKKANYPVRSSNKGSYSKFGINENAQNIVIKSGQAVLLD